MRTVNLILRYNLRSLRAQALSAASALLSVAIVVGIFCYLLALADGLRRALTITGDSRNVIVLAEAATAESNSAVSNDQVERLSSLPQLETDPDGRPLVSPEVVVQTNVIRKGDRSQVFASLVVRGVDTEVALRVHPSVHLTAGRWFRPGTDELVVGEAATRQFLDTSIGSQIGCGDRTFEIVGIFRAEGGAHESELWGHFFNVAAAHHHEMYSSAVVRLQSSDEATMKMNIARIGSAAIALKGVREDRYYAGQTENARIVEGMALVLVAIMGIGAVFAAMNAFNSALMRRVPELGMLRSLGFSDAVVSTGLLVEAALMALVGGGIGCLAAAASVWLTGGNRDLVGTTTFTSIAFSVQLRATHIAVAMGVALTIGILGGLWPIRRTRTRVLSALRVS